MFFTCDCGNNQFLHIKRFTTRGFEAVIRFGGPVENMPIIQCVKCGAQYEAKDRLGAEHAWRRLTS